MQCTPMILDVRLKAGVRFLISQLRFASGQGPIGSYLAGMDGLDHWRRERLFTST